MNHKNIFQIRTWSWTNDLRAEITKPILGSTSASQCSRQQESQAATSGRPATKSHVEKLHRGMVIMNKSSALECVELIKKRKVMLIRKFTCLYGNNYFSSNKSSLSMEAVPIRINYLNYKQIKIFLSHVSPNSIIGPSIKETWVPGLAHCLPSNTMSWPRFTLRWQSSPTRSSHRTPGIFTTWPHKRTPRLLLPFQGKYRNAFLIALS